MANISNAYPSVCPGTNNYSMGIGLLGDPNAIFKRKFRFLFSILTCGGQFVPAHFVKTSARPDISIEETEINFLNEKTWIPGKASWEQMTVTYYDLASADLSLYSWLAGVYDFTNLCRWQNSRRAEYAGTGFLFILDGCGAIMEKWTLGDMWPTSIKFGELDYSSTDTLDVELTLRYSKVSYQNFCGGVIQRCGCLPCAA